ncbi:hypothetical protein BN874_830076 [Candidatus Contendobacter odensis Run_B_J11]|uniref:Uncharacterized protein n=1 Tax=Candidatus Contendobacter odensis Run_B_J11 TaxID=1400861 RepID=A0A7U7GG88_9GAMM|nr:hypothetical protein BN874_830076 [Candidatus Contendobacter odensis Run_B_J11]
MRATFGTTIGMRQGKMQFLMLFSALHLPLALQVFPEVVLIFGGQWFVLKLLLIRSII